MNNPEIFNQNILNQITSEIVVLDKDLKVVWINDSAITNNWKISDEHTDINSQFSFQTNAELKQLIDDCIDTGNTIIKRDFKLERDNEKYRIVDLTVNWSESDKLLILEVLCVDNLHKIIDSSKVFSTPVNCGFPYSVIFSTCLSQLRANIPIVSNLSNNFISYSLINTFIMSTKYYQITFN